MDVVIDFGEGALQVPIELEARIFLVLQALEFADEVNLELRTDPHSKFKGNVFVGVCATGPASFGNDSNSICRFNPFSGSQVEVV